MSLEERCPIYIAECKVTKHLRTKAIGYVIRRTVPDLYCWVQSYNFFWNIITFSMKKYEKQDIFYRIRDFTNYELRILFRLCKYNKNRKNAFKFVCFCKTYAVLLVWKPCKRLVSSLSSILIVALCEGWKVEGKNKKKQII